MIKQFNISELATSIREKCPYIMFAYLFGSAQNGTVNENSDIDLAVYLSDKNKKAATVLKITEIVEQQSGNTTVDIVFLNDSNPILAFETIKGRRLFVKEEAIDLCANFYSVTCREYESEKFWMP